MANIFSDVLGFLGSAFRGAASIDFLRDYRHASQLFVGNDFSLVPKSGYLFHVFFDVNPYAAQNQLLDPTRLTEIGMMVRDVELPKFTIESKSYNAYNRPNLVQSKIKYDNVQIAFRDDSVNLIRNFWFDYYSYYYRDTMNSPNIHRQGYKYDPNSPASFGYSLRADMPDYRYLHAVRIYSLTHDTFAEYILVNPMITSFRHPKHDYEGLESANMSHEMTIAYEAVFYNEGYIDSGEVKGFAGIHYDRTRSPLNRVGARRNIFGRGGLINAAGSIIRDLTSGNYLSAIFKFATARQTFKGVNIKKAAVNELKQIYTQEAANAITGVITGQMRSQTPGGYSVISPTNIFGSSVPNGLGQVGSALALTGVAALLNTRTVERRPQQVNAYPSNYKPQFPTVPGVTRPGTASTDLTKANDSQQLTQPTKQNTVGTGQRRIEIGVELAALESQMRTVSQQANTQQRQVNNMVIVLGNLNNKLALAIGANSSRDVIDGIRQQIAVATQDQANANTELTKLSTDLQNLQAQINQKIIERNSLPNGQ